MTAAAGQMTPKLVTALEDIDRWRQESDAEADREHNEISDELAKYTMNIRKSWTRTWEENWPNISHSNLICNSDGGCRPGEKNSASAFIIGATFLQDGTWQYRPLYAKGIFLDETAGSFKTQSIALEEASKALRTIVTETN